MHWRPRAAGSGGDASVLGGSQPRRRGREEKQPPRAAPAQRLRVVDDHKWAYLGALRRCVECKRTREVRPSEKEPEQCPGAPPSLVDIASSAEALEHALWVFHVADGPSLVACMQCGHDAATNARELRRRGPGISRRGERAFCARQNLHMGRHPTRPGEPLGGARPMHRGRVVARIAWRRRDGGVPVLQEGAWQNDVETAKEELGKYLAGATFHVSDGDASGAKASDAGG